MLFIDAVKSLAQEVVKSETDEKTVSKIKSALNTGKSEVSKYALWRHLEVPNNELLIIPNYETGTATCTKDSRSVVIGGGGSGSQDFVGRYFARNSNSYEIISVAGNTLTLKTPFIEESGTGTFTIWKKWYRVPSDIRVALPQDEYSDKPAPFEINGYDQYRSDYSNAIVVTKNSNILTGSGFLDVVYPGDYIKIESETYRVKTVKSDTEIILTNKVVQSFSDTYNFQADTPYMAQINNSFHVVMQYGLINPVTERSILRYSYIKYLYPMVNDNDDTELPPAFDRVIKDFAKCEYLRASGSDKWSSDLQLAQARLQKLEMDKDLVFHSKNDFKLDVPPGLGRGIRRY